MRLKSGDRESSSLFWPRKRFPSAWLRDAAKAGIEAGIKAGTKAGTKAGIKGGVKAGTKAGICLPEAEERCLAMG